MEFEDFKANYDRVELCNLTPDSLTDDTKKKWDVNVLEGSWVRGSTAGGCRNYVGKSKVLRYLFFQKGLGGHDRSVMLLNFLQTSSYCRSPTLSIQSHTLHPIHPIAPL